MISRELSFMGFTRSNDKPKASSSSFKVSIQLLDQRDHVHALYVAYYTMSQMEKLRDESLFLEKDPATRFVKDVLSCIILMQNPVLAVLIVRYLKLWKEWTMVTEWWLPEV